VPQFRDTLNGKLVKEEVKDGKKMLLINQENIAQK
jgi:hypothetical protein